MIISIKIRENITQKKKTVSIIYDTAPFYLEKFQLLRSAYRKSLAVMRCEAEL